MGDSVADTLSQALANPRKHGREIQRGCHSILAGKIGQYFASTDSLLLLILKASEQVSERQTWNYRQLDSQDGNEGLRANEDFGNAARGPAEIFAWGTANSALPSRNDYFGRKNHDTLYDELLRNRSAAQQVSEHPEIFRMNY